jgi:predicted RNase H-like HicB family nuclease
VEQNLVWQFFCVHWSDRWRLAGCGAPESCHNMTMKLTAVFEPADEGGFVCWLEEMPAVQSQGETMEEAKANLAEALKLSLEYLHDRARAKASNKAVRQVLEFAL